MPDRPTCLAAVADYLTFLARYPAFDALSGDCCYGWLMVPVALAGGWPTPPASASDSAALSRRPTCWTPLQSPKPL